MINGYGWRREREVGEIACGNGDDAGDFVDTPQQGGAALRAKTIGDVAAVIADANELIRIPANQDIALWEPCAEAECAAGFALTGKAVADGDAVGFSGAGGR